MPEAGPSTTEHLEGFDEPEDGGMEVGKPLLHSIIMCRCSYAQINPETP